MSDTITTSTTIFEIKFITASENDGVAKEIRMIVPARDMRFTPDEFEQFVREAASVANVPPEIVADKPKRATKAVVVNE